eukprot:CAMPEP_0174731062 /NCGR_PEP_ID=MMETSP1094-20130205/56835_1 /TAXON_ID=156173 /ORGANISM="Chrysochromulina brevifilum, Strain UTEX LB 985" /LENGTH=66 /DNA_ID=CAMNT_0015933407 /DNA_START=8 /DNA_END=205 /DNA_ORIENTATION=-
MAEGLVIGDPHPGNLMLRPDGHLALIDFGQVEEVDDIMRLSFARYIIATRREDAAELRALSTAWDG